MLMLSSYTKYRQDIIFKMQSSDQKCLFMAGNPNIGQNWLKYLHQDLKKSWFASNKLLMICMVAILLNDTKFSNFNAKNNLFDYKLWPKNAILCGTTYNWPEEGQNVTLQSKWGSKSLTTCWCYQVTQSKGKISYINAILWPKKPVFGQKPHYWLYLTELFAQDPSCTGSLPYGSVC